MAKKAKTDDSPPKKDAGVVGGADAERTSICPDETPAGASESPLAQKDDSMAVDQEAQADALDVVDLVSPKTSPSKSRAREGQAEDGVQAASEPVPKRQCIHLADESGIKGVSPSADKDIPMQAQVPVQQNDFAKDGDSETASTVAGAEVKPVKKTSPAALSSAEKEARISMLQEELTGLGLIKLSGETILSLRPSANDIMNDFDLDAIRKEEAKTMSMKTRQVMARFLEGSARSSKEVATLLLGGAANKPAEDEEADCVMKIEECINVVAQLVERRPKISAGKVQADGSVKKWEVKDVADIPERCRALVETHRKMEVSLCERIKLIETLLTELSSSKCKATVRLDKNLVAMKDKYLKLEEREKKDREKLESKLEAERRKQQQREEKEKERERKKAEEKATEAKPKATDAKPEEATADSSKTDDLNTAEDEEYTPQEAEKPKKEKKRAEGKASGRPKKMDPVKNAGGASIMSFFGKGASTQKAAAAYDTKGDEKNGTAALVKGAVAAKAMQNERMRNFHRWEKPKNAVMAPFPYGPAESKCESRSAASPDLTSWLAVLRSEPVRSIRAPPLRDDGTPHPKMKLIQLNMKIPLVRTQLVDVDIEAEKKVVAVCYAVSACHLSSRPTPPTRFLGS